MAKANAAAGGNKYNQRRWAVPTKRAKGYAEDGVSITTLGPSCAPGTAEKVAEVVAGIKDGSVKVFDTSKFTVGGATLTEYLADVDGDFAPDTNAIWDGYFHESEYRSAPCFDLRIDGITLLNQEF